MIRQNYPTIKTRQQGAVLFIAIILLLIMTLIGATAMKMTTSEERQSGIIQDIEVAFQRTESNLRGGEQVIKDLSVAPIAKSSPADSLSGGVYQTGPTIGGKTYQNWRNAGHTDFNTAAQGSSTTPLASTDPVFVVEEIAIVSDVLNLGDPPAQIRHFFRITASGTGNDTATHALLQSTYAETY